ncbi:Helo-like-N domain-containing protein [Fusarium keratoplasticum]|nr:Helo-like-N domain-containing protein [Fusarium keratoplasticum]
MDPASLAFGVVSLAMQLMQTTTAIKKLIADYKSAAKDLAVLSDKLDDIEAVCHSLEVVLANFDEIRNPWEATLLNKLYKAIGDCRDKVSLAYDAVRKVTARHKNGRASLATVGSLFLQHRAQIRQCSDDLDRSLSSLQLHMTTNILWENADDETTFYGYAILYNANDVCRFLVEHLPDSLQRTSSHISPAPPLVSAGVYYGLKQLAFDYVDLRGDALTPGEFSTMLIAISSPARDVKTYVDYCKQRLSDRWKPFNLCLYSYLVSTFELWHNSQRYNILDDWAPILIDVLSNGVDIHTKTWLDERQLKELEGLSAVHRILASADSSQMAMERCRLWLDLLERVGVDIEQYLDVEIEHCTATWFQKGTDIGTGFRKIFAIQEFGEPGKTLWDGEVRMAPHPGPSALP